MNYTTQHLDSPYQIHSGEAFSAHPNVVDFLGTVESAILRDTLWSEMAEEQRTDLCESAEFASQTEGLDHADNPDPDEDPDAYYRVLIRLGFDDALTRADLLGMAETRAPGVLARVAARLGGVQ